MYSLNMTSGEVLEIGTEAIWVLLIISLPIMLTALVVGLVISLFQALTQIQEQTLSFVPKIIAICLAIVIFLPMMGSSLITFSEDLYEKISNIEKGDDGGN